MPRIKQIITETKNGSWVKEITTYDYLNSEISVINTDGYTHNANICNLIGITKQRGEQELKTVYSYPYMEQDNSQRLVRQFCLPIISTKRYLNGALIDGRKTIYGLCNNNIVPFKEQEHKSDETILTTVKEYKTYTDDFMLKEMANKDGVNYEFLWNDKNQLVASVANGSAWTGAYQRLRSMVTEGNPTLTDWRNFFDAKPIRIEACTYNSRNLVASKISANGYCTNYKYDALGRLTEILDKDNRQKMTYSYNYATSDGNLLQSVHDDVVLYKGGIYCGSVDNIPNNNIDYLSCTKDKQLLVSYYLTPYSVSPCLEIVKVKDNSVVNKISLSNDKNYAYLNIDISRLINGENYEARLVENGQIQDSRIFTCKGYSNGNKAYLELIKNDTTNKKMVIFYHSNDGVQYINLLRFYRVSHFDGDYNKNVYYCCYLSKEGFLVIDYSRWAKDNYYIMKFENGTTGDCIKANMVLYNKE